METLIDNSKLKDLIKQALIEAIEEKKETVHDILVEALEDAAMIRAIRDDEDSGFADRGEVLGILSDSGSLAQHKLS